MWKEMFERLLYYLDFCLMSIHRNICCIIKNLTIKQTKYTENEKHKKFVMQMRKLLLTVMDYCSGPWILIGINVFSPQLPFVELKTECIYMIVVT